MDEPGDAAPHQARGSETRASAERLAHAEAQSHDRAEQNGNQSKVIQDLLRHSSYSITANTYDAAVSEEKRKAQRGFDTRNACRDAYSVKAVKTGKCLRILASPTGFEPVLSP